jgi:hypothetical protein
MRLAPDDAEDVDPVRTARQVAPRLAGGSHTDEVERLHTRSSVGLADQPTA